MCYMLWIMARAYSVDLRERAVEYVLEGGDRDDACRIFKVAYRTLSNWLRQYKQTGTLAPKPKGSRPWKLDHDAIVDYVKNNNDSTLHEIAQHFGTVVSVIDHVLRKFNITRKKNDTLRRTRRSRATKIPR